MQNRLENLLTRAWGPSLPVAIVTAVVVVLLPILIHYFLYRAGAARALPAFLLIGPSGAGKTALLSLLETGSALPTHPSQTPLTIQTSLPSEIRAASSKFRSEHDPTHKLRPQLLLMDTAGHGKLRHHALSTLRSLPPHVKGVIFVVDSSSLSSDASGQSAPGLTEAAQYLHDVLLLLQQRYTRSKTSKGPAKLPVLLAANKLDLFTALPPQLVESALATEISRLRSTRAKGLLDSNADGAQVDDDREWLGQGGEGKFEFNMMEEVNVSVNIAGGHVTGTEGSDVSAWWEWIGAHL